MWYIQKEKEEREKTKLKRGIAKTALWNGDRETKREAAMMKRSMKRYAMWRTKKWRRIRRFPNKLVQKGREKSWEFRKRNSRTDNVLQRYAETQSHDKMNWNEKWLGLSDSPTRMQRALSGNMEKENVSELWMVRLNEEAWMMRW